jgi:hypothetical protein
MKIKEIGCPQTLARLYKGEEKIGTAHRAFHVTFTRSYLTPAEIKAVNDRQKPRKIAVMLENIAKIEKLYNFLFRNFHFLGENDAKVIRERLSKQENMLGIMAKNILR